jgi:delta8-fatty-acid desaturase
MIAQGHTIVIFEGQVLKLDSWMEKHPGGKLPLLQMVGVDASSEIAA